MIVTAPSRSVNFKRVASSLHRFGGNCPCHRCTTQIKSGAPIPYPIDKLTKSTETNNHMIRRWTHKNSTRVVSSTSQHMLNSKFSTSNRTTSDYAFEMATSSIRFGFGVTREVGLDMQDFGAKNVCVFADPYLKQLHDERKFSPLTTVVQSLEDAKIKYSVFADISIEPTDGSFKKAIEFLSKSGGSQPFDAVIAVGGGSTLDTAKAANLYASYPPSNFLDYVNPPIGKGLSPPGPLKPFIAIPTTAGTGSEATGVAIFDLVEMKAKTGIAHRRLKPTLGIVDPENTKSLPPEVAAASGFDVLCHSLESYTAIPFNERSPRPSRPLERPAYQGSNPISDVWSLKSLELVSKYLPIAVEDPSNDEARAQVMLAASFAGIGFGNAGVHLCHGMSYPVSGMVKSYIPPGYNSKKPLVPHGLSVVLHAPAVFRFTAVANPERHLTCAKIMGADISNARPEDAGEILVDQVLKMMKRLNVPNGLKALGFTRSDIPALVKGTLPQHRVTKLSPRPVGEEELAALFENGMELY